MIYLYSRFWVSVVIDWLGVDKSEAGLIGQRTLSTNVSIFSGG